MNELKQYTDDHRYLLDLIARSAGWSRPVAIELDEFEEPLLRAARRRELLPIDGLLIRDWDPYERRGRAGISHGARFYEIEGVTFAIVRFSHCRGEDFGLSFAAVDRQDYRRLYRLALKARRESEPAGQPPVLPADHAEILWQNTVGYLDRSNLRQIKMYGGRPRRGVLLTGPPGTGKTMACRWIWDEVKRQRYEWRLVTPDNYRHARASSNPDLALRDLFTVDRPGVIFFDDMDLALRDRETVHESDDQTVFLTALDGLQVTESVVFLFTTNCGGELIDRAFKRPGRIDVVLPFRDPDPALRRRLIQRWHEDILAHLSIESAVASTDGFTFAEIDELKNLLIMHYMDTGEWDWSRALRQFSANRGELTNRRRRPVGFHAREPAGV